MESIPIMPQQLMVWNALSNSKGTNLFHTRKKVAGLSRCGQKHLALGLGGLFGSYYNGVGNNMRGSDLF